jgi:hypothetical protein
VVCGARDGPGRTPILRWRRVRSDEWGNGTDSDRPTPITGGMNHAGTGEWKTAALKGRSRTGPESASMASATGVWLTLYKYVVCCLVPIEVDDE